MKGAGALGRPPGRSRRVKGLTIDLEADGAQVGKEVV